MITYHKFKQQVKPVNATRHLKLKIAASTMLALSGIGFLSQGGNSVVHAATLNAQGLYTVKAGDTLSEIAAQYQVSVSQLKTWNQLSSDVIMVGQTLQVQTPGLAVNNNNQTTSYQSRVLYAPAQLTSSKVNSAAALKSNTNSNTAGSSNALNNSNNVTSSASSTGVGTSNDTAAQVFIANRESGGSYTAQNGRYYGRYQLDKSYLNGDYSAANQEKVAQQYMQNRYGSWSNAKQHWLTNGWW